MLRCAQASKASFVLSRLEVGDADTGRASERRDWGQTFVREVRELLLVLLRALMTRVCSQFCFALVFFVC